MTALSDIESAIRQLAPCPEGRIRTVLLGISAEIALKACVRNEGFDPVIPEVILGIPVVRTESFDGWEVVEKPIPASFKLARNQ